MAFLEAAAIIAIVANAAKLVEYLIIIGKHLKNGEKQRVELETAVGAATLEVDNTSTAETLAKQISAPL